MRARHAPVTTGLDAAFALSAQQLGKRETLVHVARNTPTSSIFARLRDRGDPLFGGSDFAFDEVEEDEAEDEADGEAPARAVATDEWVLRGVSFDLARGEALGVLGRPASGPQSIARILAGMTLPTEGRIAVRGRVGPSVELASLLTRRETHPRRVARALARVRGIPRWRRRAYVDEVLRLAVGDGREAGRPVEPREAMRHVAVAASLDPYADVLVLDEFPPGSAPGFQARYVERLRERLDGGAAAVVTYPEPDLIARLCRFAVLLENGAVVRAGAVREVLDELATAAADAPARPRRVGFDANAALQAVEVTNEQGMPQASFRPYDDPRVAVRFETAHASTSVGIRVKLSADRTYAFKREPIVLADSGRYVAVLRIPPALIGDGEFSVTADLFVSHGGQRSTVGRRDAARIGFEGFGDDGGTLADETGAPPLATSIEDAEWLVERDVG